MLISVAFMQLVLMINCYDKLLKVCIQLKLKDNTPIENSIVPSNNIIIAYNFYSC